MKLSELTPAMAKQAAKDVETGSRALTNIHSRIDAKMGATPSIAKTKQFKDYKKTNQQNKIKAMKQGMPYGRQDGPGTGANSTQGGALKPMFPEMQEAKPVVKGTYKDVDNIATDEPGKYRDPEFIGGKRNKDISIQFQLRKAVNLNGTYDVMFADGETVKVDRNTAIDVLQKIDRLAKPNDKLKAIQFVQASYENLLKFKKNEETLKEEIPVAELAAMAMVAGVSVPVLKGMLKAAYKTGKGFVQLQRIAKSAGVKLADRIVGEELYNFDVDEPMKSTVAVPGYGTMNIDSLMTNVINQTTNLVKQMQQGTQGFRNADYELNRNKVLPVKIAALIRALDDLQDIRKKGGTRSRNIQQEAEQEQEQLPIDVDKIFNNIQEFESKNYMTPEDADKMRRGIQSLTTGRQTVNSDAILQLLTMVLQ